MTGILSLSAEMIVCIVMHIVDISSIHAFQMACRHIKAVIEDSVIISYKIDLIRAGYKERGLHPDYRRKPLAIIDRHQAIRRYIRAWENVDFSAQYIDWADDESDKDRDEWLKSDMAVGNGAQNTERYSGSTVAMIKINERDSFRFIKLPTPRHGIVTASLWCSQEKVMTSIFCISEERELLIFLDSNGEEDDGYYPRVHVQETVGFCRHPHAAMEELEIEEVHFGEPIGMQIFGDWVGILFQHDTPFRSGFRFIPDPQLDSTLMVWDYIHGNVLGSLTFSDSEHTVYGFELLDTDCLIVLNSGASGGAGVAAVMLYRITVDVDHRATFTCTGIFQLPVVRSSIIPLTRLTFATTRTSHVFPHSPDAPHTTDVSLTKFKPFYLTQSNHVVSLSWNLFHGAKDDSSLFLVFVRALFFMNVVRRQSDDMILEIHPWSSWGETNTRVLVNDQRFERSDYHQAHGPRFIHMGLVLEDSPGYSAVLDFGPFAPKNRSDKVMDADVRNFESSPSFPSILCTKFCSIDHTMRTWSYYVSSNSPTVIEDDVFVQPVSSSLPYSAVVVDLEFEEDVFAICLGENNLICRCMEDVGLSRYLVHYIVWP